MTPPLKASDKDNFETLRRAMKDGNLALVSSIRKSDRQPVALICAIGWEDSEYTITPLAVMVEGNPFEDFEPSESTIST